MKLSLRPKLREYVELYARAHHLTEAMAVEKIVEDHVNAVIRKAATDGMDIGKVQEMRDSGMSWGQIGDSLGLPKTTVYSRWVASKRVR